MRLGTAAFCISFPDGVKFFMRLNLCAFSIQCLHQAYTTFSPWIKFLSSSMPLQQPCAWPSRGRVQCHQGLQERCREQDHHLSWKSFAGKQNNKNMRKGVVKTYNTWRSIVFRAWLRRGTWANLSSDRRWTTWSVSYATPSISLMPPQPPRMWRLWQRRSVALERYRIRPYRKGSSQD